MNPEIKVGPIYRIPVEGDCFFCMKIEPDGTTTTYGTITQEMVLDILETFYGINCYVFIPENLLRK